VDMKARDEKEAKAEEVLMILSRRHFTLHHHLYSFFGVEMQLKSFFLCAFILLKLEKDFHEQIEP
jgi:hypothetical protein